MRTIDSPDAVGAVGVGEKLPSRRQDGVVTRCHGDGRRRQVPRRHVAVRAARQQVAVVGRQVELDALVRRHLLDTQGSASGHITHNLSRFHEVIDHEIFHEFIKMFYEIIN